MRPFYDNSMSLIMSTPLTTATEIIISTLAVALSFITATTLLTASLILTNLVDTPNLHGSLTVVFDSYLQLDFPDDFDTDVSVITSYPSEVAKYSLTARLDLGKYGVCSTEHVCMVELWSLSLTDILVPVVGDLAMAKSSIIMCVISSLEVLFSRPSEEYETSLIELEEEDLQEWEIEEELYWVQFGFGIYITVTIFGENILNPWRGGFLFCRLCRGKESVVRYRVDLFQTSVRRRWMKSRISEKKKRRGLRRLRLGGWFL